MGGKTSRSASALASGKSQSSLEKEKKGGSQRCVQRRWGSLPRQFLNAVEIVRHPGIANNALGFCRARKLSVLRAWKGEEKGSSTPSSPSSAAAPVSSFENPRLVLEEDSTQRRGSLMRAVGGVKSVGSSAIEDWVYFRAKGKNERGK